MANENNEHRAKKNRLKKHSLKKRVFKKKKYKDIAMLRILELFEHAEKIYRVKPELADIAVKRAWRLKLKYRIRLPDFIKLRFCKKCLSYWVVGETVRKRIVKGRIVYTCLNCGRVYRRILKN